MPMSRVPKLRQLSAFPLASCKILRVHPSHQGGLSAMGRLSPVLRMLHCLVYSPQRGARAMGQLPSICQTSEAALPLVLALVQVSRHGVSVLKILGERIVLSQLASFLLTFIPFNLIQVLGLLPTLFIKIPPLFLQVTVPHSASIPRSKAQV